MLDCLATCVGNLILQTLMTKLWRRVVVPVTSKCRLLAHVRSAYNFLEPFNPPDPPTEHDDNDARLNAELEKKSKIFLTIDGCWEQMHAMYANLKPDLMNLNCEAFKFAAASTMIQ